MILGGESEIEKLEKTASRMLAFLREIMKKKLWSNKSAV